jgi:lipopolysaccharide/colanic/teichoic acid biosynthesis glycosyltransferase
MASPSPATRLERPEMAERAVDLASQDLISVEASPVEAPEAVEEEATRVTIDLTEDGHPHVELRPAPAAIPPTGLLDATAWQRAAKRAMDVVLSTVLLILLSPLMGITALAVMTTSWGPALLPQVRIGKDGRPFKMYKFRSMHLGAHQARAELSGLNEANGPVFKLRSDPRVTVVGRVIRKLSLDEVPQLVNVIRGQMSLVGPRPPLPEEVASYTPYQFQRLRVRPGITCIWQVSGRSEIDFETWVDMDLEYIRDWTLRKDLGLLLKTIPAVVSGRGAY